MNVEVTKDLVGVNGIDPDRQGIKTRSIAFPDSCQRKPIEFLEIDRFSGGSILGIDRFFRDLWRTGSMPLTPTVFFVIDRALNRM